MAHSPPSTSWLQKFATPSLDWLLVFIPLAFALEFVPAWHNETWLFVVSGLAIIPLAGWMGHATEHLAHRVGQGIGGLLNATFGNAAELIIALAALSAGKIDVVKASLTGSIIGNVLLVLGLSITAGGVKYTHQRFNRIAASSSATTLTMGAIALLMPGVFHYVGGAEWSHHKSLNLSLFIAGVLLVTYAASLFFSLRTHKSLFAGPSPEDLRDAPEPALKATEHDGEEEPWSMKKSVLVLLISTALIAFMSEFLVSGIDAARVSMGLTEIFVGIIVVAIVGNAAEHSAAVWMAMKDKMDISFAIAIGSSIQIALFVAPVLVFASYPLGHPMDLEFSIAETVAVIVAIWIQSQITADGECNWLEGVQLLAVYIVLGIFFYFLPEEAGHPSQKPNLRNAQEVAPEVTPAPAH